MLQEIKEQPDWIARALQSERRSAADLAEAMIRNDIRFVVIAARGTSDNAGVYAKYLFEIVAGIPVSLAAPSVYTLYGAELKLANTLVLGISQSGQGTDVVHVLAAARASGALTACITNSADSPITEVSDHVLLNQAGRERSVAATKTYTTALAVTALLIATLTDRRDLLMELDSIPEKIERALSMEQDIESAANRYREMEECAVLARGLNQATALEAALKLTETSYLVAKPYSAADFLHGPIAMVEAGFPCFVYAPPGRAFGSMLELAGKIKARSGELAVVSSESEILDQAACPMQIPIVVDELLSPLVYVVPGQLFACHLSLARGQNPDAPRGLSKVTLTR
jgi:glucosamine--fructose-6-phosphate aminotransferase (isomerizing)